MQYLQKNLGGELIFCLQINTEVDSITLVLHCQAYPKYPKQVEDIFVISQGKIERWTWSFVSRKPSKVSSNCYYHIRCVTRHAQITQNNNFAISLQYLQKELSDEVHFLHLDKHESLIQIDGIILMEMLKDSRTFQNSKFVMS